MWLWIIYGCLFDIYYRLLCLRCCLLFWVGLMSGLLVMNFSSLVL